MIKTKNNSKLSRFNIFSRLHFDKKRTSHRLILLGIILFLCVLVEFFIFSFKGMTTNEDDYLTDFSPLQSGDTLELSKNNNFDYVFRFPGEGLYSIRIGSLLNMDKIKLDDDFKENPDIIPSPITLRVYGYDDKNENLYCLLATHYILPEDELTYQDIDLNLNTEPDSVITLQFSGISADSVIKEIIVNPSEGNIGINPARMLVFMIIGLLLWCGFVFNFNRDYFDIKRTSHKIVAAATLASCIFICIYLCSLICDEVIYPTYPLDDVANFNPYVQQFDAFLKGQLNIDVPVSDALLQLDNPYDCTQRGGISYLWDRAMYDGKYYSYFGIGPIIAFYFPHYWLTGEVISDVLVTIYYATIATAATVLFVISYIVIYKKRVRVSLIPISCISITLSSGVILLVKLLTPFYHIAVLGALAYLMLFLLFLMLAINCTHKISRPILFGLAGLSYAFLFITRINVALIGAIIVLPVLYFCLFKGKRGFDLTYDTVVKRTAKEKIIDFVSLGAFVFIAVIFSFIYNYLRFDSIFEFGTSYQLTVSDISQNGISFDRLPQMIYHTLFQPLDISGNFPYFTLDSAENMNNYGGYIYVASNFGLFAIPLCIGVFLAAFILKSKKKTMFAKAITVSFILSIIAVSFLNYFLGGVNVRYASDMTLIASVASVLFIFSFNESLENSDGYTTVIFLEKVFMMFSAFTCFMMLISFGPSFNNDAGLFKLVYQMLE